MVSPRAWCALVVLVLLVPTATASDAPSAGPDAAPVASHDHPDPGLSPSFSLFPGPDDVAAAVRAHADHPWVTVHELGTSGEGRPVLLAEVTDPDSDIPRDSRVVTFIFTQQHGNEPAGTPAALKLLDDITNGAPIASTLANQVLLLLPMANPDGALANQRANAAGTDINRDHIELGTPEARLIHDVLNAWDVHVAMDHHEYGGIGTGNPNPVRVYDYDLTTLYPVHGNVRDPTRTAAEDLMYDGIWPRAEADGYSANEYGEQTAAGMPMQQVAGGPDPGIMRNHLGLHNVAGILVETRVDQHPNPFHDAERRTAIHTSVMEATLEYVHTHPSLFKAAKALSATANVDDPFTHYHEGERAGAVPDAWGVSLADGSDALFARHGLDAPLVVDDRHVHDNQVPLRGHVQAILHPDSSRQVFAAAELTRAAFENVETSQGPAEGEAVPGPGALLVVALLSLGALWRSRRG